MPKEQVSVKEYVTDDQISVKEYVPDDQVFVSVKKYIPGISVDLKYAAADNFTGHTIYEFQDAYLRYGTVKKLMQVCSELKAQNLSIKIWDAFRPAAAQFKLWEVYPNEDYVANPNIKFSAHTRGNTLDLTLTDLSGNETEMPSEFDDFSERSNRDYSDCNENAAGNAGLLEEIMEKYGFCGLFEEWWHFSDCTEYPVEKEFQPGADRETNDEA